MYNFGLNRESNPGPHAPEARIIPLDHWATRYKFKLYFYKVEIDMNMQRRKGDEGYNI